MPFVKRDERGEIVSVSSLQDTDLGEELLSGDPELTNFLNELGADDQGLNQTDQEFVRVTEDLIDLLVSKGLIMFTELPDAAQDKILQRKELRSGVEGKLDLLGPD